MEPNFSVSVRFGSGSQFFRFGFQFFMPRVTDDRPVPMALRVTASPLAALAGPGGARWAARLASRPPPPPPRAAPVPRRGAVWPRTGAPQARRPHPVATSSWILPNCRGPRQGLHSRAVRLNRRSLVPVYRTDLAGN